MYKSANEHVYRAAQNTQITNPLNVRNSIWKKNAAVSLTQLKTSYSKICALNHYLVLFC